VTSATVTGDEPAWVGEVIRFWLQETPAEARFKRDEALDAEIERRFSAVHADVSAAPLDEAVTSARRALATVIVLDQFSRNMFRGSPKAFASDTKALAVARKAIALGFDGEFEKYGRLFLYLPFEHSENLADQECSVALIAELGDAELDRYAVAHLDIIRRYGRFPHRNAVLGRESTPEELEFLEQPGSSF
jgi:uncharacterized protein (DUF924 family)